MTAIRLRVALLFIAAFSIAGAGVFSIERAHAAGTKHPITGPDTTCTNTKPCFREKNLGTGIGVGGIGTQADGVVGETDFNSTSPPGMSGVLGKDASARSPWNNGVFGTSVRGTGVSGASSKGVGVSGQGLEGVKGTGNYLGGSLFGVGVYAVGGTPVNNCGGALCLPVLIAQSVFPSGSGVTVFVGEDNSGNVFAYLDDGGNLHLSGKIYTGGSCSTGCVSTKTATGRQVVAYAPRETAPTMEDFGTGVMTSGRGFVRLDASFQQVIDRRSGYYVFLTPHGDSHGLYVTGESSTGFVVRENSNGTDSLMFDYRIVAKPYDMAEQRLPRYAPHSLGTLTSSMK